MDPATASRKAGFAPTFIRDLVEGRKQSIRGSSALKLARVLQTSVEWLLEGRNGEGESAPSPPDVTTRDQVMIPEYDVIAGAGRGALNDHEEPRAHWPFSRRALDELRLRNADLAIIEISGDSMSPTLASGDRVMIDRSDKRLPGIFVIHDGDGLMAKRLERLPGPPNSPPRIRITSDNKLHNDTEAEADWVQIVGRVVGLIRRL